jgi:6-phosphogluconolactonase
MVTGVARKSASGLAGERIVLADAETLARYAAAWLLNRVLGVPGRIAVCLSGGETPKPVYALMAQFPYRDCFPWERVHWFWGDERCVPHDHPRSNYRMVREALLDHAKVLAANIHPIPTDGDPASCAARYAVELQRFYGAVALTPNRPLFAATLLGLGLDGHTASLFPGSAALAEAAHWTAAVPEGKPEPRITLTYPALDSSAALAFLASGADKRPVLERLARGEDLPASRIRPAGRMVWLIDRAAMP